MYLLSVVRGETEGSTAAGGKEVVPVSPGHTVRLHLLHPTPGLLLAQSQELLRHLDLLDVPEPVVSLSRENYRDWV